MRSTHRSWSVVSLLLIGGLCLASCAAPPAPTALQTAVPTAAPTAAPTTAPAADVTGKLVMLDWSGYELPEFWPGFAAQYPKVNVEFSFMAESAETYTKLQSGFEADLVHPCNNYWQIMVDEKMVQPIDTTMLSNWKDVIPALGMPGAFGGQQYWIPWDWGFESILVRKDLVKQVPTAWADLWDPQYKGHIALYDSGESNHVITALALGLDPWATTPEQDAQIKQKLLDLMPNVLSIWSSQTEMDQMVASGDAWLAANAYNASYVVATKAGLNVDYINPKEGRTGYVCGFAVPTTSKNMQLATAMIDAYLAPASQAKLANDYGYGIVNQAAFAAVDPATVKLLGLEDQAVISKTHFYKSLTAAQRESWTNMWSEVKTSK